MENTQETCATCGAPMREGSKRVMGILGVRHKKVQECSSLTCPTRTGYTVESAK